jgi:predicted enzyme related to lactoylglutathione lyase
LKKGDFMKVLLLLFVSVMNVDAAVSAQSQSCPQAPESGATLKYLGGLSIRASNPKALAHWYTQVLEFQTTYENSGAYFGMLCTPAGPMFFAIKPNKAGSDPVIQSKTVSIVFRVSGFDEYVRKLRERGAKPSDILNDPEGRFVLVNDPEGNEIGIWGN